MLVNSISALAPTPTGQLKNGRYPEKSTKNLLPSRFSLLKLHPKPQGPH